jgi:hypothetical protein
LTDLLASGILRDAVTVRIIWRKTWHQAAPSLCCRVCASAWVVRLGREGLRDYVHSIAGRYPFRCRRCAHQFYLPHRGSRDEAGF